SKLNELIISEFNAADLNFEVPEPVAHTNYDIPAAGGGKLFPETPQSIACLYMFPPGPSRDCINTDANVKPTGGANITIAIVIAYDHDVGTINEELRIFSQNFQILDANFLPIVYASGAKPHQDPTKNK